MMIIEADDTNDLVELLVTFIADIYAALGVDLPDDLDPEVELVRLMQAVEEKRNALRQ
jgi:hypothetical protein